MQGVEKSHGEQQPTRNDPRSTAHDDQARSAPAHDGRLTSTSTNDEHEHEHEHAHAHAHDEDRRHDAGPFPHEKLDVYRVALEMAALAKDLAKEIPRGHRNVADHLQRAADGTVLLIAEGANRRGRALKRQRFVESCGEAGEVAAAADLVVVLDIGSPTKAKTMKRLAGRVCAMLTRLIAKFQ